MWVRSRSAPLQTADSSFRHGRKALVDCEVLASKLPSVAGNESLKLEAWGSLAAGTEIVAEFPKKLLQESSFRRLDARAAAVLGRSSLQALESSSSLTSCASIMTNSQCWKDDRDCEQGKQGRGRDCDSLNNIGCSQRVGYKEPGPFYSDHNSTTTTVLNEIINRSYYASHTKAAVDRTLARNREVAVREKDASEVDRVGHLTPKLSDEMCQERADKHTDTAGLSKASGLHCASLSCASDLCQYVCVKRSDEVGRATGSKATEFTTHDRRTQTELMELLTFKIHPKIEERSGVSPHTNGPGLRSSQDSVQFVNADVSSLDCQESNHAAEDPTGSGDRKLNYLSNPPNWKGLSAALSIARSICHGDGDADVVDAGVTPVVIIAGNCIFQTIAPLDTPRQCTVSRKSENQAARAREIDDPSPATSAASEDTLEEYPLVSPTNTDPHPAAEPSVKPWPAVVADLDNWISEIVNKCLHESDQPSSMFSNASASVPSNGHSNDLNITRLEGKPGVLIQTPMQLPVQLPKQTPMQLPVQLPKPLPLKFKKHVNISIEMLTQLDTRISEAQSICELSEILEPISQGSFCLGSCKKVEAYDEISQESLLREFRDDELMHDLQRQMHILQQEIQ